MTDRTHPDSGRATGGIVEMLQARIAELEAQLAAIGAGGVTGPLIGQPQAIPDLSQLTERGAVAWAGVDAQALREGRWYMVNKDGMATRCADEADAEREAADAQAIWPGMGPHRAVQLVEASTAGFTAADMATAASQGFRDGVASLSANAGEPRNAIDREALIDAIAQGLHGTWHCARVWEAWHVGTMSQDDFEPVDESETPTEIADAVLALLAAPPTAQAEGWTKTEPLIARSRGEWHEDDGPVVWWSWNGHGWAGESPWCGTPLDSDWPGYHTHWTPAPPPPTSAEGVEHG